MRKAVLFWGFACMVVAAARAQVNLPPGFETVEIAVDERFTSPPSINNCGQIVYSKEETVPPYGPEIYLYDNGRITQITHNDIPDDFPVINDAGDMAWIRYVPELDRVQLVFLRDGVETVVDEAWALQPPAINNHGHLAWSHYFEAECNWNLRIMFWDGATVTQITPPEEYYNQQVSLNDFDEIVWTHMNVCVTPWTGHILAFFDGETVNMPVFDSQEQSPNLNNGRHVVWRSGQALVLLDETGHRILAPDGSGPKLNEQGNVFSVLWNSQRRTREPVFFRVTSEPIESFKLSERTVAYYGSAINEADEAACSWLNDPGNGDYGGGILFMRRIRTGDCGNDGIVDLVDYAEFSRCFTGPRSEKGLCTCRFLDMDHDDDVDLRDYSTFQTRFGVNQ